MKDCPHARLDVKLNIAHFGDTNIKYLEITATCEVCDRPMTFRGVPDMGQSPDKPMVNIDATEIRLPIIAEGEAVVGKPAGFTMSRDKSADN
jgi:hypothetical protein